MESPGNVVKRRRAVHAARIPRLSVPAVGELRRGVASYTKRLMNASALSATFRHPLSITSA
jgi:hypothetical protein